MRVRPAHLVSFVLIAVAALACACSSSSAPQGQFTYRDKCNARCRDLACSPTCEDYSCSEGSCAGDCSRLTQGLALSCAQCVIEQTVAASSSTSGSACGTYAIGVTTATPCQVACGTGNGAGSDAGH